MTSKNPTFIIPIILFFFTHCGPGRQYENARAIDNHDQAKHNLKDDLARYNGFYTSVEMIDGQISPDNIPVEIRSFKNQSIQSTTIEYLTKAKSGYLLTFNIRYQNAKALIVSTLDSAYSLIDYRRFTNGLGLLDHKEDTITIPSYHENAVTLEFMHPNKLEEPDFDTDGIMRETLMVTDDLKLVSKRE